MTKTMTIKIKDDGDGDDDGNGDDDDDDDKWMMMMTTSISKTIVNATAVADISTLGVVIAGAVSRMLVVLIIKSAVSNPATIITTRT